MSDLPIHGTKEANALPFYIGKSGKRKECLVEKPSTDFRSPLGQYKREPSMSDPKKLLYRVVSEDPMDTMGREMVLLDCAEEDADLMLKAIDREASRSFSATGDPSKGEFGGVKAQEPVGVF